MRWIALLSELLQALAMASRAFVVWTASRVAHDIATLENQIYEIEANAAPDADLLADRLRVQLQEKRRFLDLVPTSEAVAPSQQTSPDNGGDLHPAS